MLVVAFLVVALVLFILAAIPWPPLDRYGVGWLGLAFVTLAELVRTGVF